MLTCVCTLRCCVDCAARTSINPSRRLSLQQRRLSSTNRQFSSVQRRIVQRRWITGLALVQTSTISPSSLQLPCEKSDLQCCTLFYCHCTDHMLQNVEHSCMLTCLCAHACVRACCVSTGQQRGVDARGTKGVNPFNSNYGVPVYVC